MILVSRRARGALLNRRIMPRALLNRRIRRVILVSSRARGALLNRRIKRTALLNRRIRRRRGLLALLILIG